jgi:hypothetical protein
MNRTWRKKEEQIAEREKILESAKYGLPEKYTTLPLASASYLATLVPPSSSLRNRHALTYQYTSWSSHIDNAIDEVGGLRWP